MDGPLIADTITYTYDQLGQVTARAINSVGVTWAFDALARVTSEVNVLGTFGYTYDGVSGRVAGATYPNQQTSTYSYFDNAADRRLQSIHHKYPGGATLSRFDYTYDGADNILTWRQQADTTAVMWAYGYDAADQLTWAIEKTAEAVPTVLKTYMYAYDPAGNRASEQIDDQLTGATYDVLNRLSSQQPAGAIALEGTVSEPAVVRVHGKPAVVTPDGRFTTTTPVVVGTNSLAITATDPTGNTTTRQYEVDSTGSGRTFTYDANGNLTSDGTRTFEWDARSQLVAVTVGTLRSEFTYDGLQRRVRIVEKDNGVVQSDTKVVWCETGICEERAADGTTVTRRAFTLGEQAAGIARFFAADHLGSIGEVTNGSSTLLARYAYDAWGRRSLTTGTDVTKVGYTGHQWQATGGLWLTQFRGYDAELGRWASEDPYRDNQVAAPEAQLPGDSIAALVDDVPSVDEPDWSSLAESADPMQITPDGPNLYGYVRHQPTALVDPTGQWAAAGAAAAAAAAAARVIIKKVINECKKIRCKPVRIDPPHHPFLLIGKRCHAQLNCWRQGVKGSDFTIRVPVPCSWRK